MSEKTAIIRTRTRTQRLKAWFDDNWKRSVTVFVAIALCGVAAAYLYGTRQAINQTNTELTASNGRIGMVEGKVSENATSIKKEKTRLSTLIGGEVWLAGPDGTMIRQELLPENADLPRLEKRVITVQATADVAKAAAVTAQATADEVQAKADATEEAILGKVVIDEETGVAKVVMEDDGITPKLDGNDQPILVREGGLLQEIATAKAAAERAKDIASCNASEACRAKRQQDEATRQLERIDSKLMKLSKSKMSDEEKAKATTKLREQRSAYVGLIGAEKVEKSTDPAP
jgi:hypothetical protein